MEYPINFSIHASKIVDFDTIVSKKTKLLSNIIPYKPYSYNTEKDYYNEYQSSLFAITQKKHGWDCLRHYEILMNGCIPYFVDIDKCPTYTMTTFPFALVKSAMLLYDKMKLEERPLENIENVNQCLSFIKLLLEYTKTHLTNEAVVKYVLKTSGHENANSVLFLGGDISPDYLRCLTLTGLKDYFRDKCHDFKKIPHIYNDYPESNLGYLYGKGMTYAKIVDSSYRNNELDETVIRDILNHRYDIVIYGSLHRGLIYYDLVSKIYKPNEIIIFCGEDPDYGESDDICKKDYCRQFCKKNSHTLFRREIQQHDACPSGLAVGGGGGDVSSLNKQHMIFTS